MKCKARHSSFIVQIILTLLLCFAPSIAFSQITIQIPDTTSEQVALKNSLGASLRGGRFPFLLSYAMHRYRSRRIYANCRIVLLTILSY